MAKSDDWRNRALCDGVPIEVFFPSNSRGQTEQPTDTAKQLCGECPVRDDCLDYALTNNEQYGVWGGLDEYERAKLRRQQQKAGIGG